MAFPLPTFPDKLDANDARRYIRLMDCDFDDLFTRMGPKALVINDLPYETKQDREAVNRLIITTYDNTDLLSAIPSCVCGYTKYGDKLGRTCVKCGEPVQRPAEHEISMHIWLRCPEGVHGFITPAIWMILSKRLSSGDFNLLEWLTNPSASLPDKIPVATERRMRVLMDAGWKRGLNYFIEHIDDFIALIPRLNVSKPQRLLKRLAAARGSMFPKYLPMPSKILLVLEKTNRGTFTDLPIAGAIDAVKVIKSMSRHDGLPIIAREKLAVSVVRNISNYYRETFRVAFRRKKGWWRGQVFGSRSIQAFRSVITPIIGPHRYNSLHLPWTIGVELYKYHIINHLINRYDYGVCEAYGLVESHGRKYHPMLDQIMFDLINERVDMEYSLPELDKRFPKIGLGALFQRNPTLARTSSQYFNVDEVKSNVHDTTISLSPMVCNGPNADFDGDGMNGQSAIDNRLGQFFKLASPHFGIHSLREPGRLNNCTALPEVTISTVANYVNRAVIARAIQLKEAQCQ